MLVPAESDDFANGRLGLGLLDSSDHDWLPALSTAIGCCLTKRQERNRDDCHEGNADPPGYGDSISAGVRRRARVRNMAARSYVVIADEARSTVPLLRIVGMKQHGIGH